MASVREHLTKMHETMASHHRTMSECHGDAMAKEAMALDDKKFHKAAAAAHDEAAQAHDQMCQECEKADSGDLEKSFSNPALQSLVKKLVAEAIGNTLMPTRISAVAAPPPGLVAVPRFGARPIPAEDAAPVVEPQFSKLFSTGDSEPLQQ